jgi:hypothetical protein
MAFGRAPATFCNWSHRIFFLHFALAPENTRLAPDLKIDL